MRARPPAGGGTPLFLIVLLGLLLATLPFAVDLTLPSMPMTAAAFGTSDAAVQFSLSAFVAGLAAGQLVYGPVSDRFGRRPVLMIGLGLFLAASIGCALAPSIEALTAFRAIHGLAACAMSVLARAVVRDLYRDENAARMYAQIMMVHGLAPLIGPILGAHLTIRFGWQAAFWFLAAYAAVLMVLVWRALGESLARRDPAATRPADVLNNYVRVLTDRPYVGYLLAMAACYSGLFAFLFASPATLINQFGLSVADYGYLFSATMLVHLVGTWVSARLVRRRSIAGTIVPGALVMAASGIAAAGLGLARIDTAAAVVAPVGLFMFAFCFIVPPAQAAAMSRFDRNTGAAASMMGFVQLAFSSATGALVGHFADGTQIPMVLAIGIASLCPIAAYALIVRPWAETARAVGP